MNKIEELLEKLCPNGVEYNILNTICDIYDGTHQTPKYKTSGIKFVSVENIQDLYATNKYISEEDYNKYKIKPQKNDILMTRIGKIGKCTVIDSDEPLAYYVSLALLRPNKNILNSKFLKYYIESRYGSDELFKRTLIKAIPIKINLGDIGKISIAVPPLEIQSEIVRILDKFTELIALLKAELKARKQQYEYYREKLLNFDDNNEVDYKLFGEIAKIQRGASPRPIRYYITKEQNGINWIKIGDVEEGAKYITSTHEKITEEGAKNSRYIKRGSLILSNSMSFGRPYILAIDGCIHDGWLSISNFEQFYTTDFLYFLLNSNKIQDEFKKKANFGGAIHNLNADIVRNIILPIPTIKKQNEIVKILDKFYSLCNDLTAGIPAEIEARQKQYEYYRDKLLTFKELNKE